MPRFSQHVGEVDITTHTSMLLSLRMLRNFYRNHYIDIGEMRYNVLII
jgi:hypothetical protein